jgi:predicted esterase
VLARVDTESCQLVRRELAGRRAEAAPWIALHADGADAEPLLELARALAPDARLCAPQAPRSRNPLLASGAGDPRWGAYRGFSWYRASDDGTIEPASFGDSLAQLEALLRELASPAAPWLLGLGRGATLAIAAARSLPELVAGAVAIAGEPLRVPGWTPPDAGRRPVMLVVDPLAPGSHVRGEEVAVPGCAREPRLAGEAIAAWLARQEGCDGRA